MATVQATVATSGAGETVLGGDDLKRALARAERRNKIRALVLVLPLFAFIAFTFLAPIFVMLKRSTDNPTLTTYLPRTVEALTAWNPDETELPPEQVYAVFAEELLAIQRSKELGRVAKRLSYEKGGVYGMFKKTGRRLDRMAKKDEVPPSWKDALIKIDKKWGRPDTWTLILATAPRYTTGFFLKALDLRRQWDGSVQPEPANRRLYLLTGIDKDTWLGKIDKTIESVWVRTLWISGLVTIFCALLGYPVAHLLANLPLRISNLLMILVLLPFWTSLLVRTTAWVVVLQTEGVLNDLLIFLGVIDERIQLIFNRFGVLVSMTHILLPFMILPIYSVMKTIPPSYVRAARSLGATPWTAFWRVCFPQSLAGVGAGGLLVFILALGYYITPALVGGPTDQLVSYFIADHTTRSLNWGLASALGTVLLLGVLAIYILYDKVVGLDNMKLG